MEGILWKWTNYWSGWQTRWFILDNGVLAYYKSQEDVSQGCKGSMKVAACQINVNALDSTRLDLVIPGEQQIFLRASSAQERQLWLVALGSTKACVQSRGRGDTGESKPDALKSKRSELRLYCDLLMQQVHSLKTAALLETGPDIKQMDDATNLLGATCDTFITTLEECMKLAHAQTGSSLYDPQGLASTPVLPPTPTILNGRKDKTIKALPVNRSCSNDSTK